MAIKGGLFSTLCFGIILSPSLLTRNLENNCLQLSEMYFTYQIYSKAEFT